MATSGVFTFGMTIDELVAEGAERAELEPSTMAGPQIVSVMRSVNLALIEFENRGHSLYRRDGFSVALSNNMRGYRLPLGTIDVISGVIRNSDNDDRNILKISRSDYEHNAAKDTKAQPYSFFVSFDVTDAAYLTSISSDLTDPTELSTAYDPTAAAGQPILVLFPCPDADSTYTFVGTRLRQHQKAGQLDEHVDLNHQWYDAICANIAMRLADKYKPEIYDRKKAQALEAFTLAKMETGSRAPVTIVHNYRPSRRRRF